MINKYIILYKINFVDLVMIGDAFMNFLSIEKIGKLPSIPKNMYIDDIKKFSIELT